MSILSSPVTFTGEKIVFMISHDHVVENQCSRRPLWSNIPPGRASSPITSV